jgi:hypothetical protein
MAPVSDGGELVRLDWGSKRVEARVPITPVRADHDPNPRGNTRGCRGIAVMDGRVVAASYDSLEVFDTDLRHAFTRSHGLMVGLHESAPSEDGRLWVTSTAIDAALEFDPGSGELLRSFWPREMSCLARELDLAPSNIDKNADNRLSHLKQKHGRGPSHLHLNAVAQWKGRVLALFHAHGVIADLTEDRILVRDPCLRKCHNLLVDPDGTAVVNDSQRAMVRVFDLESARQIDALDLKAFDWVRRLRRIGILDLLRRALRKPSLLGRRVAARPLFLRGMDRVGDRLYLGLSPAAVVCLDLRSRDLVDAFRYSGDVRVCVHGLSVWEAS